MINNELIERQVAELRERLEILADAKERNQDRTQDTEEVVASVCVEIPKLTPNDDLEAIKRVVNQIIDELSKN